MVSIIIPIYKVEKYLCECVDSVINQTYKDLEIILVDDGSPDNCGKICDEYAKKDSRIKVIHKENGGLSDARNAGMEIATGEYIYFLDSDDYIKIDAMEQLVNCIEKENADFIYFDAETIVEDFEDQDYYEEFIRSNNYSSGSGPEVFKLHIENKEYYSVVWLLFLKRSFIQKNHLQFYKGIVHEDELYTPEAFLKAQKVSYLNKALYVRRLRSGSIMSERMSVSSMTGIYTCIVEYNKWIDNYSIESIEYKILQFFMIEKAIAIIEIYCNIDKVDDKVNDLFHDTFKIMSELGFCGCKKLMIKYSLPFLYRLYVKYIRPVKERVIHK